MTTAPAAPTRARLNDTGTLPDEAGKYAEIVILPLRPIDNDLGAAFERGLQTRHAELDLARMLADSAVTQT